MTKNQGNTKVKDRAFRLRSKQANCLSSFIFNQNIKRVTIARPEGNAIKVICFISIFK